MIDNNNRPYGFIYKVVNPINGKIYIGQTISSRWSINQDPIEGRWKEEIYEAYRNKDLGESLRYIEKAIIKYGPDNFFVTQIDNADNQSELDEKEKKWITKLNALDRKNMVII